MKEIRFSLIIVQLLISFAGFTQVVSTFSWSSGSPGTADSGPNATSISSSATISTGGATGNGLNPGLPKTDINLTLAGSPTFDAGGIDVQFKYQREESVAGFFKRGSSIDFGFTGGNLYCNFRIDNGAGSYISVNSGSVFAVPDDDIYRTYRFYYLPSTGVAKIIVDGVEYYSYDGTDNRNLYIITSDNIVIGSLMDGSGTNKTCLDAMVTGKVTSAPLPVELISFDGFVEKRGINLKWITASEKDNDYFNIEHSEDGSNWETRAKINGAGNSNVPLTYEYLDEQQSHSRRYYRLKQFDYDGKFTYSKIITINSSSESEIIIYPNPVKEQLNIRWPGKRRFTCTIYNNQSKKIITFECDENSASAVNTSTLTHGIYLVQISDDKTSKTFTIAKE
ncbi:hypothetical protein BH11BAC2_BH11BAC2_00510 [soil metagenome]